MKQLIGAGLMAAACASAFAGDVLEARDITGDGVVDAYYDATINVTFLKDTMFALTQAYAPAFTPNTGEENNPGAFFLGTMTYFESLDWVTALNFAGVTGWRLPTTQLLPFEGSSTGTCVVFTFCAIGTSELTGLQDAFAQGLFLNTTNNGYWMTNPDLELFSEVALGKPSGGGLELERGRSNGAWAVHDGDVGTAISPVPEPSTYALLLAGLGAVGFAARRHTRLPGR